MQYAQNIFNQTHIEKDSKEVDMGTKGNEECDFVR